MSLKISKKKLNIVFVALLMFAPSLLRGLVVNYNAPISISVIGYTVLCLLIIAALTTSNSKKTKTFKITTIGIMLLLGISGINFVRGDYTVTQYFQGLLTYFHFFVFYIVAAVLLNKKSFDKISRTIILIIGIDAIAILYQFFFLGLKQDKLGGLFGNANGCNGIQNTFSCIGLILVTVWYLDRKCKLSQMILYCAVTAVMAGLAEITMYFFEMLIIIVFAVLLNANKKMTVKEISRILAFLLLFVFVFYVGVRVLFLLFPTKVRFLQVSAILEYLGGKNGGTGVYKISRLHAVSQMKELFLNNSLDSAIGMGIGSTGVSSTFYRSYSNLQYNWFSSATTMLETGFIGVIFKMLFFGYIFWKAQSYKKINNPELNEMCSISQLVVIYAVIMFFYNNTLENIYDSYLIAGFLASFLIGLKEYGRAKYDS